MKSVRCYFALITAITMTFVMLTSAHAVAGDSKLTISGGDDDLIQVYMDNPEFQAHYEDDPVDAMNMLEEIINSHHQINEMRNTPELYAYNPAKTRMWVDTDLVQQVNSYYCGPASALMAIWGWGGTVSGSTTSAMQRTLAQEMDTDSDGSVVYKVRNTLNSYLSTRKYNYYDGGSLDEFLFRVYIVNSLSMDRAPLLHARTEYLPYYNGHSSGHYITITEFDYDTMEVTLYDPNYRDKYYGIHTVSVSDALACIPSGRYLIAHWSGN